MSNQTEDPSKLSTQPLQSPNLFKFEVNTIPIQINRQNLRADVYVNKTLIKFESIEVSQYLFIGLRYIIQNQKLRNLFFLSLKSGDNQIAKEIFFDAIKETLPQSEIIKSNTRANIIIEGYYFKTIRNLYEAIENNLPNLEPNSPLLSRRVNEVISRINLELINVFGLK